MEVVMDTNTPSTVMEKAGQPAPQGQQFVPAFFWSTLITLSPHKKVTEIAALQRSSHLQTSVCNLSKPR